MNQNWIRTPRGELINLEQVCSIDHHVVGTQHQIVAHFNGSGGSDDVEGVPTSSRVIFASERAEEVTAIFQNIELVVEAHSVTGTALAMARH